LFTENKQDLEQLAYLEIPVDWVRLVSVPLVCGNFFKLRSHIY